MTEVKVIPSQLPLQAVAAETAPEETKGGIKNTVSDAKENAVSDASKASCNNKISVSKKKGVAQSSSFSQDASAKFSQDASLDDDVTERLLRPLIRPRDYPSGIREWMMAAPEGMEFATLAVLASMLSVYLTRVRIQYVYDNEGEQSAIVLQVIVEGEQSSGKSFARFIMRTMMQPFVERDREMRAKEQEYAALKRRQGKKDGKLPPEPKTDITILPETVSLTMFIKRCDAAMKLFGAPKTLFEFADEISAVVQSAKRQFSDLTQIIKTAYDLGSTYGQDYLSENSYSAVVDALLSFVFCGTKNAVSRYMNKGAVEGGNVTRSIIVFLESHLGGNPPQFKSLDRAQKASLSATLKKLMALCYVEDGTKLHEEIELDMSWLDKTVMKWCDECRKEVVRTMSKSMDTFYKRSSVSAFRMASLLQMLYQVEGVKSEKEIHRLVKQTYLACADRILQNMLQRWGNAYEEINADGDVEPYHTTDYFRELPQEFSRDFLKDFLKQKGLKTPVRNIICNWRRMGWIEKPKKGDDGNILRKLIMG